MEIYLRSQWKLIIIHKVNRYNRVDIIKNEIKK